MFALKFPLRCPECEMLVEMFVLQIANVFSIVLLFGLHFVQGILLIFNVGVIEIVAIYCICKLGLKVNAILGRNISCLIS